MLILKCYFMSTILKHMKITIRLSLILVINFQFYIFFYGRGRKRAFESSSRMWSPPPATLVPWVRCCPVCLKGYGKRKILKQGIGKGKRLDCSFSFAVRNTAVCHCYFRQVFRESVVLTQFGPILIWKLLREFICLLWHTLSPSFSSFLSIKEPILCVSFEIVR